jgi:hypothetical protein
MILSWATQEMMASFIEIHITEEGADSMGEESLAFSVVSIK